MISSTQQQVGFNFQINVTPIFGSTSAPKVGVELSHHMVAATIELIYGSTYHQIFNNVPLFSSPIFLIKIETIAPNSK